MTIFKRLDWNGLKYFYEKQFGIFARKNHTHEAYALADHNHDEDYAALNHTHAYLSGLSIANGVLTFTKGDGTQGRVTLPDSGTDWVLMKIDNTDYDNYYNDPQTDWEEYVHGLCLTNADGKNILVYNATYGQIYACLVSDNHGYLYCLLDMYGKSGFHDMLRSKLNQWGYTAGCNVPVLTEEEWGGLEYTGARNYDSELKSKFACGFVPKNFLYIDDEGELCFFSETHPHQLMRELVGGV